MPRDLNWTSVERVKSVTHSWHKLGLTEGANAINADELYQDLHDFVHFNGGHNHVALVYTSLEGGVRYALFDMLGPSSWLSWLANPRLVPVRIWCDQRTRTVVADTAEQHMLIGQRRWSVEWGRSRRRIRTEAYERPRGIINRVGMWLVGRQKQSEIWRAYLENIKASLSKQSVSGSITVSSPEAVVGNPWEPREPYPGCA